MESYISQVFQEEFRCSICLNYLTDPVTTSCGHNFCRACLCLSWEDIQPPAHCPVCREPCQQKDLRTNLLLKKLVSNAREASIRKCLSTEENLCDAHKEAKKIFCQDDRMLVCELCSRSEEHEGHTLCPIEVAVEEQREKVLKQMTSLWEKIEENQRNLKEEMLTIPSWQVYMSLHETMIRNEYRKYYPFLYRGERQHIKSLRKEGKRILKTLRNCEAMMVQKSNQLRGVYQELLARCQGSHLELLQDLGETLTRSESVQLCMPQPVKPVLRPKPITGVLYRYNRYQEAISFANVTVIHYRMSLFKDVRRFSFRNHLQDTSVNSDGCYRVSWGDQSFSKGKHYWELNVTDSSDWALGVCKDSQVTRCGPLIEMKHMFLLVYVKEGEHHCLLTTSPSFIHHVEIPLGRVGVLLDCELGSVSFLNVAKNTLIWSYPRDSFHFPVMLFSAVHFI